MGFFNSKFLVEYEYSDSEFLMWGMKKDKMVVDGYSKTDAEATAKKVLNNQHSYVRIIKVTELK